MQRSPHHIIPVIFGLCASLSNCSLAHRHSISVADASEVMSLATKAVARAGNLPTGYCVLMKLAPANSIANTAEGFGGWSTASPELAYRLVASPKLWKLPAGAITSLPTATRRSDCLHPLAFHEPQFMEVRQRSGKSIMAIVSVDAYCRGFCSSGHAVSLRKTGEGWVIDPPGVSQSWIS